MQKFAGLAKALRGNRSQGADQSRPDQGQLALAQAKMFDQPELQPEQSTEKWRKGAFWWILLGFVHWACSGAHRESGQEARHILRCDQSVNHLLSAHVAS